jgi:hypothetical protein
MTVDFEKINLNSLITKIKTKQEVIAAQTVVASIDIDLQLDYIRTLYEYYVELKHELTSKIKAEEKFELSDCGTLPIFNNSEKEGISECGIQNVASKVELEEESEIEDEEEDFEEEEEDLFEENEEIDEEDEDELEDDEEDMELEDEEDNFEEEEDSFEENEEIEDEKIDEEEDFEIEIEEEEQEEENFEVPPSFTAFPQMEIETNIPTNSDIDIDAIEFEEDDEDTDIEEIDVKEMPIPHIGTPGQPRYWGDELDVEPIPTKPTSIGDQYISNKPSLNEIVSAFKPDDSIGMKLQHTSVSDLMKSIDMNLKFLFVKNLFKGNGSAFTEEINKINSIGKLHEAIKYVEEIKDKYNWDDKSEAYTELYKLVLRKYAR